MKWLDKEAWDLNQKFIEERKELMPELNIAEKLLYDILMKKTEDEFQKQLNVAHGK